MDRLDAILFRSLIIEFVNANRAMDLRGDPVLAREKVDLPGKAARRFLVDSRARGRLPQRQNMDHRIIRAGDTQICLRKIQPLGSGASRTAEQQGHGQARGR